MLTIFNRKKLTIYVYLFARRSAPNWMPPASSTRPERGTAARPRPWPPAPASAAAPWGRTWLTTGRYTIYVRAADLEKARAALR